MNRILIWGAGAIGGTIGAYLTEGGLNVTFVDLDASHVEAMNTTGLTITGPIREFTVPVRAYTPDELEGAWDTIILATKSQHTAEASHQLAPHLGRTGVVVSTQNGLNEVEIADVVGWERTFGAFVNFGADYLEPGKILYGGVGAVYLGEMDGTMSVRAKAIHQLFSKFDSSAVLTGNIMGYLWAKLAYGAMLFATALTDESIADSFAIPRYQAYFVELAREVLGIAALEGITPEPFDGFTPNDFLVSGANPKRILQPMIDFNRSSAKTHSGIWRDLAVRKRKTESDSQLGPIIDAARKRGADAPMTARIVDLIHQIEDGKLSQGLHTLELAAESSMRQGSVVIRSERT